MGSDIKFCVPVLDTLLYIYIIYFHNDMGSDIKFCVPVLDTPLPIRANAFVLCEFELTLGVTVSAVYFILFYMTGQDITCRHSVV